LARGEGADEETAGRVAIVASEMTTNLLKHAGGGNMIVDLYRDTTGTGVEMVALDRGKGIGDIDRAMSDGYSTSGTSGGGLGAIKRQSDDFAVFSRPNQGTAVLARVLISPAKPLPGRQCSITLGIAQSPYPGEHVSGDSWAFCASTGPTVLVVDGTGHGPLASAAAATAVQIFNENAAESCPRLMEMIHRALVPTRGGAVAIARFDPTAAVVRFVGIGNICAALVSGDGTKRMISNNGIVGGAAPRIREFTYDYNGPATVILHSDGLSAKWDLNAYPGLAYAHPGLIAGVLFRDFWRARDDGLVVALKAA
jgi:anti-sigma regulatory factor (Ser/Thr protein kinase)